MSQPQLVTGPFLGGSWGHVCGRCPQVSEQPWLWLCWPFPCPLPTPTLQVGEQRLIGYLPLSSKKVTPAWPAMLHQAPPPNLAENPLPPLGDGTSSGQRREPDTDLGGTKVSRPHRPLGRSSWLILWGLQTFPTVQGYSILPWTPEWSPSAADAWPQSVSSVVLRTEGKSGCQLSLWPVTGMCWTGCGRVTFRGLCPSQTQGGACVLPWSSWCAPLCCYHEKAGKTHLFNNISWLFPAGAAGEAGRQLAGPRLGTGGRGAALCLSFPSCKWRSTAATWKAARVKAELKQRVKAAWFLTPWPSGCGAPSVESMAVPSLRGAGALGHHSIRGARGS